MWTPSDCINSHDRVFEATAPKHHRNTVYKSATVPLCPFHCNMLPGKGSTSPPRKYSCNTICMLDKSLKGNTLACDHALLSTTAIVSLSFVSLTHLPVAPVLPS